MGLQTWWKGSKVRQVEQGGKSAMGKDRTEIRHSGKGPERDGCKVKVE